MPGARCTRSRACSVESTRVSHHGRTGITRHSRTRMVLTVSFALSPVTGLVCHRRRRSCLRRLDASVGASGPHDFAVRVRVARLATPTRPSHPAPNVRGDCAYAPLSGAGRRKLVAVICPTAQAKYFCAKGWTGFHARPLICPSGKSLHEQDGRGDTTAPECHGVSRWTRIRATQLATDPGFPKIGAKPLQSQQ
jgi:hypothetical protein